VVPVNPDLGRFSARIGAGARPRMATERNDALQATREDPRETGSVAGRGERALVRRAQGGSEEALESLYRANWPRAHRAAYLIVHDPAAAEDIAQEAFLAAVRSLHRFDRRRPFGPWLHRIVVNRSIDWGRRQAIVREVSSEAADEPAVDPDQGVPDVPGEDVMAALAALPIEQRAVVVLRYLLDHTPGEIARLLELPRGTVNSRLRRGLDRLGKLLPEEAR
jgi:RNA polymerase sigma-70 factor (ECF subfamily)